jgi:uncharacterized Zn-binding protein involved in type VI secretion
MGLDPGQAAGVAGRASRNAAEMQQQNTSAFDVWSHTTSGAGAEQIPGVSTGSGIAGIGAGVTREWSSSSAAQVGDSMSAQASGVAAQAMNLVGMGDGPGPQGALQTVGASFALLTSVEQLISAPFSAIPFPAFPALRILDMDIGLPHGHAHPPNLVPPAPMLPLPSTGPIIPIPILSGASKTLINGMPAARCGDFGLGVWCGGYFPMYEVFLGSSSVWIEGARAGRMLVDITKHCVFTSPRPSDPPAGPMIGTTIAGSANVVIGGVPMPSLTSLALGAAFKGLFRGAGALFRKLTAQSFINRMLQRGTLVIADGGDAAFRRAAMADLVKMARTRSGRTMLREMDRNLGRIGDDVTIRPPGAQYASYGDSCNGRSWDAVDPRANPNGTGRGVGSDIEYNPSSWPNATSPRTSSDTVLFHEMNHANNNAAGRSMDSMQSTDPAWNQRWTNWEEYNTVHAENGYRSETGQGPLRTDYGALP